VPLREFFSQFSLIARANDLSEEMKIAILCRLRRKARAILENVENLEILDFANLEILDFANLEILDFVNFRTKIKIRVGLRKESAQNYYS